MKEVKINLNEKVKFKLTLWGKEVYRQSYDKVNEYLGKIGVQPLEVKLPKCDENGYCSMQLWEFMNTFGPSIGMSFPNVIEPIELIYVLEDTEDRPIITKASPASIGIHEMEADNG